MIDLGNGVQLIPRPEWGARAPRGRTGINPTFGSTSHWEGPHMGEFPHESCAAKVRGIQDYHMDAKGWQDIAYNLLTCPHGFVFEGRGVGVRSAANGTNTGNDQAYAVCYLSGDGDPFTDAAKRAQRAALDYLDTVGSAGPGRNCHRDWKPTECPGDAVCAWVDAGQPVPGGPTHPTEPPATPQPHPPEDDDMAVIKYRFPAEGGKPELFGYQLPDGTLVDKDWKGAEIDANEAKDLDAVFQPGKTVTVLKVQFDRAQSVAKAATRERLGAP